MKGKKVFASIFLLVCMSGWGALANATLTGDHIDIDIGAANFPITLISEDDIAVGPFVELFRSFPFGPEFIVDVGASNFHLQVNYNEFSGPAGDDTLWVLSDLDWLDNPGFITSVSQTGGDIVSRIAFSDNSISVVTADQNLPADAVLRYDFVITAEHFIPVPATTFIVSIALALLVMTRRKDIL